MAPAKKPTEPEAIHIPAIEVKQLGLTLVGDSPLIVHAWSVKAKEQMLAKQMKKARQAKEAKIPERDFLESLYIIDGDPTTVAKDDGLYATGATFGFPAIGIKASAVSAARYSDQKMTVLRGAFHIDGELVEIQGSPRMREDMVRIGMGVADVRYRAEFPEWQIPLVVKFNANVISPEQVVNLYSIAGFGCGLGEWRPERDGSYGRFHVA